jgi:protocatechuate 3,4-dioxygenase beta subunit
MSRIKIGGMLLLLLLALFVASCGGGSSIVGPGPGPGPDNFERMTAQVLGADNLPLSGLSIRVEGRDTGLITNSQGAFTLEATDFPNGVDASNELSFGKGGFVVGTQEIVPSSNPNPVIAFEATGDPGSSENGSLGGQITDATSGSGLDGVQVTLFSLNGGVFQTESDNGAFDFQDVPAGSWQLAAYLEGYNPAMAFVQVQAGEATTTDIAMKAEGTVGPGDGLKVKGVLRDSVTNQPIAGAFLSMSADTGYWGIPRPGIEPGAPQVDPMPGGDGDDIAVEPDKGSSMSEPFWYDPSYQETTTAADGSFEFENEVVAYSVWINMSAEGYLAGNYSEEVYGETGDTNLELELEPIVPASVSGRVVDENGDPVAGALVEFVFNGWSYGGNKPIDGDIAVPPVVDFEDFGTDSSVTSPVPPPTFDDGRNNTGEAAPGSAAPDSDTAAGGSGGSGNWSNPADNMMMQRFRFDHQNGRGTSDVVEGFDGYESVVTGEDGTFEFSDIPAGPYYVFSSAYRHLPYSTEYEAEAAPAENDLEIVLPNIPVGSVEGDVVDENGTPIDDALVNAVQPNVDPFTYTDATGHSRIDNIPAGDGWTIGAYKQGYLTSTEIVNISDNGVVNVHLVLTAYEAPEQTLVDVFGTIYDGSASNNWKDDGTFAGGEGIGGADIVFTPVDNTLGSYYRHIVSGSDGKYSTTLIDQGEYNLLIQAEGFQDLFTRVWSSADWRQMDYWLFPISGGQQGGGGWGVPVGNVTDAGTGTGGGNSSGGDPGSPDMPPPTNVR